VEFPVTAHTGEAGLGQAPGGDPGTVEPSQEREELVVDVDEVSIDLAGLEREVPLEGPDAAALEVDPPKAGRGHQSVALVRFAVKPVLGRRPIAEDGQRLVKGIAQERSVGGQESGD
jgi:hypothetical protein